MPLNVNEIVRKLSPAERKKVEDSAAAIIAEEMSLRSVRDYVLLAAPEPEVLRAIGEESKRKGTASLSSRQIDRIIKKARAKKS